MPLKVLKPSFCLCYTFVLHAFAGIVFYQWQTSYLGDGIISREELKTFIQEIWQTLGDPREALRAAVDVVMRHMDRDGNGYVSKHEFR